LRAGGGGRKAPPPGGPAAGLLALLAVLLPLWLIGAPPALAHATLIASAPPAGASLAAGPAALVLVFDEPVQLLALQALEAAGGTLLPTGPPTAAGTRLELPLAGSLPAGRYLVSWRVASLDGHVVSGSFGFAVGEGLAFAVATAAEPAPWAATALRALARVLLLLALGLALFEFLRPPAPLLDSLQRTRRRCAAAALVGQLAFVAALGAERAGLPAWQLWQPAAWLAAVAAPGAWLQGLTLLGLLLLALPCRGRLLLQACLVVPASLAAGGHVLTQLAPGLGQGLMLLHGLAAAAWIGALLPLRRALRLPDLAAVARLFRRFQSVGLALVAAVLASGLVMALVLLPRWSDLWQSDYGLRLLAKLAPVACMLAIAIANRFWLTRLALAGEARPRRRLVRVLRLDLAAALIAVVLAAGLALGPPPAAALRLDLSDAQYGVLVTLAPARIGDNRLELVLARPDGTAFDPQEVSLRLAAPAAGIEPWEAALTRLSAGRYELDGLPLWVAGPWELRLRLLIDQFTRIERAASVTLP